MIEIEKETTGTETGTVKEKDTVVTETGMETETGTRRETDTEVETITMDTMTILLQEEVTGETVTIATVPDHITRCLHLVKTATIPDVAGTEMHIFLVTGW